MLNLSYNVFTREKNRKESVSSRESYTVAFSILLSQHLQIGQRPPSARHKHVFFQELKPQNTWKVTTQN